MFLAAEGAALEATICLSGSKEISVPVMHFWVRPCPFCQCTYKVPYFRQWVKANLVPSVSACVKQPILTWTWTDHYTYLTQSDHWAWTWTDHYIHVPCTSTWNCLPRLFQRILPINWFCVLYIIYQYGHGQTITHNLE